MRFPRRWAAAGGVALACALTSRPAAAQLRLPAPVGYVNDFANVIDPAYRDSMLAVIDEVRAKSGGEIVVVTLPSLEGRSRDEVALQIGREWKVGRKGEAGDRTRNTGTIVLVSIQDRKYKIETGDRTMTFVTAAEAGRIGRDLLVPELQRGNVGRGIYLAVAALGQAYAKEFNFQLSPTVRPPAPPQYQPAEPYRDRGRRQRGGEQWVIIVLFILFFLLSRGRVGCLPLFFMSGMGGGGRGGGWGGGGFGGGGGGGGFGGFGGGGGFSGGGSGGDW